MRRWARLVFLSVACAATAVAQAPVSVGYQKKIEITVAGATAAYSMDSEIAEASVANGIVQIQGRAPGIPTGWCRWPCPRSVRPSVTSSS